ncbi:hypothetical protein DA075_21995 [Methylobacterium currus]|jgi:hypothetical protein|uniref:Uncharacterized protein n=1 Tax=Methylobacterium currus TaxID=2051553 RepID=A0A2R4WNX0_9HYPH|nr:hypothetical protein [Methylobacterium currus]AWB23242.1 hypothetical protein DA075_21995 [Methylobacterium currus]UHC17288.1 hypothetical protein LRS73_05175 [Methylobacterium currus]
MQSGKDFIDTLRREHARLGRLVDVIDNGRWWTTDMPGGRAVADLDKQAKLLVSVIDEIDHVVGRIGSS